MPLHACSIQYSIKGFPEGLPTCRPLVFGAANCSHLTSPTLSLVTSIKESCLHSDVLMLPLTWKFSGDGMLGGPTVYLFVSVLCRVSNFCLLMASVWNTAVSDAFLFAACFCWERKSCLVNFILEKSENILVSFVYKDFCSQGVLEQNPLVKKTVGATVKFSRKKKLSLFVPSSPLVSIDDVNDCQGSIAQEEKPKKQVETWIALNHIRWHLAREEVHGRHHWWNKERQGHFSLWGPK